MKLETLSDGIRIQRDISILDHCMEDNVRLSPLGQFAVHRDVAGEGVFNLLLTEYTKALKERRAALRDELDAL